MRLKKGDFKAVCKLCMNGDRISKCPSKTCLLAPIKDGKPFRASIKKLKTFCRACDPEGYMAHARCQTVGNCPLDQFYNELWGKRVVPGLTYVKQGEYRETGANA